MFTQYRSHRKCYQSPDRLSMHPMYHPIADRPFKHGLQYFGIHQVIHSIHRSLLITLVIHNPVENFMNTFSLHTSLPGLRLHPPTHTPPDTPSAPSRPLYSVLGFLLIRAQNPRVSTVLTPFVLVLSAPLPVRLRLALKQITLRFTRVSLDRCLHDSDMIQPCTSNSDVNGPR